MTNEGDRRSPIDIGLRRILTNRDSRQRMLTGHIEVRSFIVGQFREETDKLDAIQRTEWVKKLFETASLPPHHDPDGLQPMALRLLPLAAAALFREGSSHIHQRALFDMFSGNLLSAKDELTRSGNDDDVTDIDAFLEASHSVAGYLPYKGILRRGMVKEVEGLTSLAQDKDQLTAIQLAADAIRTAGQAIPHEPMKRRPQLAENRILRRMRRLRNEGKTFAEITNILRDVPLEDVIHSLTYFESISG